MDNLLLVQFFSFFIDHLDVIFLGLGIIFRESIIGYIATKISKVNSKEIEKFKSSIRVEENARRDLSQQVSDLYSSQNAQLFSKKIEAAEDLLKARQSLAEYQVLALYMQVFDIPRILSTNDVKTVSLFKELMKPFVGKLDGFKVDKTKSELFLGVKSLKAFEIYELIVLQAYITMNLLSLDIKDRKKILRKDSKLVQLIIEYVPSSKEGFERYGENYVYYWVTYFYDEIKNAVREEIMNLEDINEKVIKTSEVISRSYLAANKLLIELNNCNDLPLNPIFIKERNFFSKK